MQPTSQNIMETLRIPQVVGRPHRHRIYRCLCSDNDVSNAQPSKVGWLWDRSSRTSITRRSLREQNIRPKKSLGQNFMTDESVLEAIAAASRIRPGDAVLEIGPGTGVLTRHLLSAGAALTAIEKDRGLYNLLKEEFSDQQDGLNLIHGDVLRQDLSGLLSAAASFAQGQTRSVRRLQGEREEHNDNQRAKATNQHDQQGLDGDCQPKLAIMSNPDDDGVASHKTQNNNTSSKVVVVANLPYYITKEFLVAALPLGQHCSSLVLMLQHEVAERLTARDPGGADWRAINVLLQYYTFTAKYVFRIDRRKYVPRPKVDGAVVEFKLRPPEDRPAVPDERRFISLVKKAFLQRRKTLRNSLQPLVSSERAVAGLVAAGLDPAVRAQMLTLDDFVRLAWALEKEEGHSGPDNTEAIAAAAAASDIS